MINVLIVEDSSVMRQHIRDILESDPGIRVMASVADGQEAVDFVASRRPDVITMDIDMPRMNGLEATRRIMETFPVPIVVVSASFQKKDMEKTFLAVEAGAVAIADKPFGEGHPRHDATARDLIQTVKLMSEVRVVKRWGKAAKGEPVQPVMRETVPVARGTSIKAVAIGASTGGPPVVQKIILALPADFPAPVFVVQHIARGFIEGMVDWIGQNAKIVAHVASEGMQTIPGHVYFAPDACQMGVDRSGHIRLGTQPGRYGIIPSVAYLFNSVLDSYGAGAAGVLLTGMGEDGARELKLLRDAGAMTVAQDMESCIVSGMPGAAIRLDAVEYVLTPDKIAGALISAALKGGGKAAKQ